MKWCVALLAFSSLVYAEMDEEQYKRRIQAHLLIQDRSAALIEAQAAALLFPQSELLHKALIRALCEQGEEREAISQWVALKGPSTDRKMLEVLAWGVLGKGIGSAQLGIRLNSLLGSAFTHDAKAIPFLLSQLRSSNATLRAIALRLATSYADAPLKSEVMRLLREERVWYVRLTALAAAGAMHLHEARLLLKEVVANPRTLAEEKATAIVSLVGMYESIEREELLALVKSDRAGLRQLASEVIAHLHLHSQLDLLYPLLTDTSSDVKISALSTLALLRVKTLPFVDLIAEALHDTSPEVAITAAYVLLLNQDPRGSAALEQWLTSQTPQWRRLSSAALAVSGRYGVALSASHLEKTQDPYVKVNLARGLIGQRFQVNRACRVIKEVLSQEKQTLWMWETQGNPLFRSLAPSQVRHIDSIPHYPSVVDQMTRLELFSILSMMRTPGASQAVKEFLETRSWGVTGAAAATLIQEGDEGDLEVVRELLHDPDEKIRCQAALILALIGNDVSAVSVLQESYPHVDREMKVHILEALARIGDPSSIPFLLSILQEPFQLLRVVAASALIQCLYH